jgi:hypothetical protein
MLSPLRAALVPKAEIDAYAAAHNKSPAEALSFVAAAVHGLIRKTDGSGRPDLDPASQLSIEYLLSTGKVITNAEFCFVSEVDDKDWATFRNGFLPIEPFVRTVLDSARLFPQLPEATLKR